MYIIPNIKANTKARVIDMVMGGYSIGRISREVGISKTSVGRIAATVNDRPKATIKLPPGHGNPRKLRRADVEAMLASGLSKAEIARRSGASVNCVQRTLKRAS